MASLSGAAGTITNSGLGGATLTVSQSISTAFNGTLQDGAGTLGLVKYGSSMLTLAGSNNFSGGITIGNAASGVSGGTLVAANNNAFGTTNMVTSTTRSGGIAFTGGITLPAGVNFTVSNDGGVGGVATVPFALDNISGNNTILGTVSLAAGGGNSVIQSDSGLLTLTNLTTLAGAGARTAILAGTGSGQITGLFN